MKINYLTEIKMFNEWLETNELSTSGIALWYALMYLGYRSGWQSQLRIPLSVIMLRTKMSRSTIYREREVLRDYGLIDFDTGDGRQSSSYRIIYFEERFVSQTETQSGTQAGVVSHTETQVGTQIGVVSHVASHTEAQVGTQNEMSPDVVFHTETQTPDTVSLKAHLASEEIEKVPIYINKDRYKDKRGSGGKKKKPEFDLSFIGDQMWESLVRTWLDYKHSRREDYKSELSVRKFLTMLRNYSGGDPATAQKIIDKSIANNWAGIFELNATVGGSSTAKPATGQRIGQIIQPASDDKRQKLLKKFDKK